MTSVSSQVEALSSTVDGIISSLTMLGDNATGIEAGLMAAQSELASITAALEGLVTSKELGLISSTLADLQADINEILENNAIVKQNITINKLTGDYIEAVAGTLTTPYVEAQIKSNDLNHLTPYFQLAVNSRANATTGNVTYTLNINLSDADAGTTGAQDLSSQITNDTNAVFSGPPANGTGLATVTLQLDTNFVALVRSE